MGSTRFPSKMLCQLGDNYLIEWVFSRVSSSLMLDEIVLATSNKSRDDCLEEIAVQNGIKVFRGEENNVLNRFYEAATENNIDIIIRICADNPFIDSIEIDRLIKFYLSFNDCDYSFNHLNRLESGYADGFGAEIFSKATLERVRKEASLKTHKEHVTSYIWDNLKKFNVKVLKSPVSLNYPDFKFDIDNINDKNKIDRLIDFGINIKSDTNQIISAYKRIIKNEIKL